MNARALCPRLGLVKTIEKLADIPFRGARDLATDEDQYRELPAILRPDYKTRRYVLLLLKRVGEKLRGLRKFFLPDIQRRYFILILHGRKADPTHEKKGRQIIFDPGKLLIKLESFKLR